jgi:hypothetical protein
VITIFDRVCSRDEEYKRKVEYSVEPVVVTLLTSLDDKCKAVASDIGELSDEYTTIKFYQVTSERMICYPEPSLIQNCQLSSLQKTAESI